MVHLMALLGVLLASLFTTGGGGEGDGGDPGGGAGDPGPEDEPLGEAGKRALDRERQARRDAERRAKALEDQATKAQEELAKAREAQLSETEKAIAKAQADAAKEAREEEQAKWRDRILATALHGAAVGKLANPEDAIKFVDVSGLDPDDQDLASKLGVLVDELVKERPYLKGEGGKVKGNGDGGTKPKPSSTDDTKLSPHQRLSRAYADLAAKKK